MGIAVAQGRCGQVSYGKKLGYLAGEARLISFSLFARLWEDSILSLIGDQFDEEEGIVGMVLSVRGQEDILSVWSDRERDGGAGADLVDTVR